MLDAAIRLAERRSAAATPDEVTGLIRHEAGLLPQVELEFEAGARLLWITMRPEPKPVLTPTLLDSVRAVQLAVQALWGQAPDRPILFVGLRAFGPIFSLGTDLDFILDCLAKNDEAALTHYARTGAEVLSRCRDGLNGTAITFSAVTERAMGGGIDLARSCHIAVAQTDAVFSYPEVRSNQRSIAAVPVLARHVRLGDASRILLSGQDYSADDLCRLGALDAVVPAGEADGWIRREASAAVATQPARLGVIAACNRRSRGDLGRELAAQIEPWVAFVLGLRPVEIARLQGFASEQERLLGQLLGTAEPASAVPSAGQVRSGPCTADALP